MEGPASMLCLRTCYIEHCKPLGIAKNPSELRPSPLSRSCSCSRGMVKQERSNSVSMCSLPIIPEYPGFQDVKLSKNYLGNPAFRQIFQEPDRGKKSPPHLSDFPRTASVHCPGSCPGCFLNGRQPSSAAFQDKPLQEYFNERLRELGGYESKRSNRKSKAFSDQNRRGARRRSGCGSALGPGQGEGEEPGSSARQHGHRGSEGKEQKEARNVLKLNTGDFLDLLTMHITAPLEAFVQKK